MTLVSDRRTAGPANPVLRTRALTKTYGSGETVVHALMEVDLDVRQGEFIVLLGASGSGKSTLLNILGGLDPWSIRPGCSRCQSGPCAFLGGSARKRRLPLTVQSDSANIHTTPHPISAMTTSAAEAATAQRTQLPVNGCMEVSFENTFVGQRAAHAREILGGFISQLLRTTGLLRLT